MIALAGINQLDLLQAVFGRITAMLANGIHYHPALIKKLIKHAGE